MIAGADTSLGARVALWGGREIVGLILVSLVAGLATTPYAAYHFHRLAPYGVLANLLAMPVVSVWVMPMGILGARRDAVRLRRRFWRLMGEGIDWMIAVALWVASLPGAVGRMRGVRHRSAAARHRRAGRALPAQDAVALERRALLASSQPVGGPRAAARCAGRRRRRGRRGARRRRTARHRHDRQRHLCRPRMARRRRRCAAADGPGAGSGRSAATRSAASDGSPTAPRLAGADAGSLRGGLPPRCRGGQRTRGAGRHARALVDRPQGLAKHRRDGAAPDGRWL